MEEFLQIAKNAFPVSEGSEVIEGIQKKTQVLWDKYGIPHIYAHSAEDAYFVQGYIHAEHRLWQMELFRRLISGELSEIFREDALESDKHYKIIGLHRIARQAAERISKDQSSMLFRRLEAYRKGVNVAIVKARDNPPLEFAMLDLKIRDWNIEDSLKVMSFIEWGLSNWNYPMEILREHLINKLGTEEADKLLPLYYGANIASSKGSNGWVVGPSKSETDSVLFANDPHLPLTLPPIWFLIHLNCPEINSIGASFPGIPLVVLGHNEKIAWGCTNVHADTIDLFKLEINPNNKHQYKYNGEWINFDIIEEPIYVKEKEKPVAFNIFISKFGPLVKHFERDDRLYKISLSGSYALRWSSFGAKIEKSIEGFMNINMASNWLEFQQSLKLMTINPQNFIYGDIEGNIGLQHGGKIPVRSYGDGATITPGTSEKYNWTGLSSFEQLLSIYNPESAYIFTANFNEIKAPNGLLIAQDRDDPYRHRRLKHIFLSKDKFAFQDFIEMQLDYYSEEAAELLPIMLENLLIHEESEKFTEIIAILDDWDFHLTRDSIAAMIYKLWFLNIQKAILTKIGDDAFLKVFLGSLPFELKRLFKYCIEKDLKLPYLLYDGLQKTTEYLKEHISDDIKKWKWGNIHQLTLVHPFSLASEDAKLLNIGAYKIGGDRNTINNAYSDPLNPFDILVGPSFRQIHDLNDWDKSICIIPGGQSGLPFHKHYKDLMKLYVKGKYIPMLFSKEIISEHLEGTLNLKPA
jgi:penicillin amidase